MDGLKARLSFDAVAYDYDDEYLTIDTDTHTININNVSRLFGVQYDGNSKLIKFRVRNKLSDIQKMQDSIVYINWIDSRGVKGQSIAINKTINNDTCEFAWKVPFDALKNSGVLHFAMSAVVTKNSSSVIDQRWSTKIASVITPDGIYIKSYTPSSEEEDRIAQIYNELSKMINKLNDNLQSQVNSLKKDLAELGNKILHEEYADLLHGKEPKEKWYIDSSNGAGRKLAQFFSYIDIDVSEYIGKKLYPYTSHKGTTVYHSSRSVVFYDESGAFISGTGVSSNNPINGIEVPKKSKTASICFNYESDDNQPIKPQVYYLAINRENKNKLMLKNDVLIDYKQIQNKPIIPTKMSELENDIAIDNVNDVQTIRKPTISFIFDDGLPSVSDFVSLFDSYGWKCGFAILANSNLSNIKDNFLSYQSKGYEILSHSTDGVAMQDGSLAIDDVETKMKKSKEILINNGFNITGWVTPSTWLNNKYFDNLCKYYEYGFGHLDTNQVVYHHVFWGNDIRQLERWSLESNTLERTKAEIDATINECGYLCFYAHAYQSTVNGNFTVENMKIIMDYIKKYIDNGKVQVLTPRCAINDYYTVRHSDLLNLYKKVIN